MERVHELACRVEEHREAIKAILAESKQGGRAMTAAERSRLESLTAELHSTEAEERAERALLEHDRGVPAAGELPSRASVTAPGPRSYRDLFGDPAPLASSGFKDPGEFFDAVGRGQHHSGLVPVAAMGESTGASGGFLTPEEISAEQLDAALENEVVRPRARVVPMASDTKRMAGFAASDSSTGPYGFSGGWLAEGATLGTVTPLIRSIVLRAKKCGFVFQASNELVADGEGFADQARGALVKAISWLMDYGFFRGSGAGEPLGILNAPCTVEVAKEAAQVADTLLYENITKMFSRLLPSSINNSVWVVNPTAIPALLSIQNRVKNMAGVENVGGAPVPVQTSTGSFTLLTRPVLFSEKLPPIGDRGDILLADFSFYGIGLRKEVSIDRSAHVGFTSDLETFRGIVRADGQPLLEAPYTPKNGATQSAFVTLAERA